MNLNNQIAALGYVSRTSYVIAFGYVWRDQATAAKETTEGVTPMPFIFAYGFLNSRDKRPQNTCVGSDKLVFFFLKVK